MDNHTKVSGHAQQPAVTPPNNPTWHGERHDTAWGRVKDAFRRDWEQTKADFPGQHGHSLNQSIGDTFGQAFGSHLVPTLDMKTRPNSPEEAAREASLARETMVKADSTIADAHASIADATAGGAKRIHSAQSELAEQQTVARAAILRNTEKSGETIAKAKTKIGDEAARLTEAVGTIKDDLAKNKASSAQRVSDAQREMTATVSRQQDRITDATARREDAVGVWQAAEQAGRYGYSVRGQYTTDRSWDDDLEIELHAEWDSLHTGLSWAASKGGVYQGWDLASTGAHGDNFRVAGSQPKS